MCGGSQNESQKHELTGVVLHAALPKLRLDYPQYRYDEQDGTSMLEAYRKALEGVRMTPQLCQAPTCADPLVDPIFGAEQQHLPSPTLYYIAAGIGGGMTEAVAAGYELVGMCESDAYCRAVRCTLTRCSHVLDVSCVRPDTWTSARTGGAPVS